MLRAILKVIFKIGVVRDSTDKSTIVFIAL